MGATTTGYRSFGRVLGAAAILWLAAGGLPALAEPNWCPAGPPAEDEVRGLARPVESHKLNYVLPYTYDWETHEDGRQPRELKFQISFKKELWPVGLFLGYTQKSFWQVYNGDESRPFRESNYNPEIFYRLRWKQVDSAIDLAVGIEHESNGRGNASDGQTENPSRSWNRLYLWPSYRAGSWRLGLKYWDRFAENLWDEEGHRESDNPDIDRYLGRFEFTIGACTWGQHPLSLLMRRGQADDTETVQVDYLIRIGGRDSGFFLHLQYFDGYGESLIDYNREVQKLGIGFAFE